MKLAGGVLFPLSWDTTVLKTVTRIPCIPSTTFPHMTRAQVLAILKCASVNHTFLMLEETFDWVILITEDNPKVISEKLGDSREIAIF